MDQETLKKPVDVQGLSLALAKTVEYVNQNTGQSDWSEYNANSVSYINNKPNIDAGSGYYSIIEGGATSSSGSYSHAEGNCTIANHRSQHVFGEYNVADIVSGGTYGRGTYIEIVGKGTSDGARSNARTLDWSGNEVLAGKLTVGTGPTENMDVATKQYVDAATAGISPNLSGLSDTNIANPATGQILTYDGTTSKWVNTTSPYMTASQVNELIATALAEYGNGDTASYGFEDASEVSY